jgi:putative ABC transport system permease protein
LADLRALVQTQLGSFSQSLILLTFGLSGILVAAILYGLVVMRRKDFGRRRALGAAQSLIVSLVLSQIVMLAAAGATAGSVISAIALAVARNPLPPLEYFVAVAFLAITIAVLAAVFPAVAAARRDPLTELRVP